MQPERPRRVLTILAALILLWPVILLAAVLPEAEVVVTAMFLTALAVMVASIRGLRIVAALIAGIYATFCTGLCVYRVALGGWLDLSLTLAMPDDTLHAVMLWLGKGLLIATAAALLAHMLLYAWAVTRLARMTAVPWWCAFTAAAFFLIPPLHEELIMEQAEGEPTADVKPLAPKSRWDVAGAREPIYLVQLESLNGIAANGEHDLAARGAADTMRRLARNGIYLPHTWAHDIQTHRASEAFMCGAVRNLSLGQAIDRLDAPCIPDAFRKAGYRTVFLSSWFNENFANKGKLMKKMGYGDVRFAEDLMQPGDEEALWGYDEKIFFRRAFEYLRKHYRPDDRLLVHLAVCAHHVGFTRKRETDHVWFTVPRQKQIDMYMESARKQDASLQTFWDHYAGYTGENGHVFIFGDHSFPLGLYGAMLPHIGASIDNFVTPMAYIPPKARAAEFKTGTTIDTLHGHSDLPPTFVELVTRKPQPNSLVPFLSRTPPPKFDYEQCHIMAQPFGIPGVLTARGNRTYRYIFNGACVETATITYGPLRQRSDQHRECWVPFAEYDQRYTCARYR